MSERQKWIFHITLSIIVGGAVIWMIDLTQASRIVTFICAIFLLFFLIIFNFFALRNFYSFPYQLASARIRSLILGDLTDILPSSPVKEAQHLFNTINDLSSELQAKSKMIEKLERMRIDFVANVSHELKTPLTSIKGYTETLKAGAMGDPAVNGKFLNRIEENADRLISIIGDLLVLSHLEGFPQEVKWEPFDASQLREKLDHTFMPVLEKKNQKLILNFEDQKLEGDLKKLEHVFLNLIDNSHRYCPENSTIEITEKKNDLHWIYEIKDNGPGIPLHHQPRIFERFYRIDPDRSRETGGTGLGLSIVKHIALLHDGSIRLESTPGHGTRFIFEYPRKML